VTTDVAESLKVTELTAKTTYHFRLVVTSNAGLVNGNDGEFTTLPLAPTVTTGAAGPVTQTSAAVAGEVNPKGAIASCHFDYGLTTSYGSTAGCPTDPGSGESGIAEQVDLTGLAPGTTYHYRLVGANAGGTTNGLDQSFTTQSPPPAPLPPVAVLPPPTEVPISTPTAPKCKKGFQKKRVHGKLKCVKRKKKHRHR
jgi:hypothetical protein